MRLNDGLPAKQLSAGQIWRHKTTGLRVRLLAPKPSRHNGVPGWFVEYPDRMRDGRRWYHAAAFTDGEFYELEANSDA